MARTRRLSSKDLFGLNSDLSDSLQEVRRIPVNTISSRLDQFCLSIPSAEQANSKRLRPPRSQQIPDTISNHDTVTEICA